MEDGVEISNLSIPISKGDKGDAGKISSLVITMLESDATPTVINNGTVYDARYVLGIPRGKSIASTNINVNGELVITFDDETTITVGEVVGTSVANMYVDENGDLIVELTDSTELIVGNLGTILAPALEDYYDKDTIDSTFSLITETGNKIDLTINSSTYVMTLNLRDKNNNILSTGTVDLPLEAVVVNGRYDSTTKKLILTLQNGNTIEINIGDLVSGLQAEITSNNKLSADLVDDTNTTNKFVTSEEKAQITQSLSIKKLTENLIITNGNVPSLDEGYYYTNSYHVTVNGSNMADLDSSIFYLDKSISGVDFSITKIWGSGAGYPYVCIDKLTGDDEINVIERAPLTSNQLVTSISSSSTNNQIPSAKCVYDLVGDIGTALDLINGEVI